MDIHLLPSGSHGYVWHAPDAISVRKDHRLLGSLLGGVAQFKNQNSINGLPLQLNLSAVATAAAEGWATVHGPCLMSQQAELLKQPGGHSDPSAHPSKRQRRTDEDFAAEYEQYYMRLGAYGDVPPLAVQETVQQAGQEAGQQRPAHTERQQQQQQQHGGTVEGGTQEEEEWRTALTDGSLFAAPLCARHPSKQRGSTQQQGGPGSSEQQAGGASGPVQKGKDKDKGTGKDKDKSGGGGKGKKGKQGSGEQAVAGASGAVQAVQAVQAAAGQQVPVEHGLSAAGDKPQPAAQHAASTASTSVLPFPQTQEQARHLAVFRDLHERGYALSAGPKFGAHLLAYPGDPSLFHAQFGVRVMAADEPIAPQALKAAARGSHGARKHLLLATVLPTDSHTPSTSGTGGGVPDLAAIACQQPVYITLAPEGGFGKAAKHE